jgi:hypothetical protein
LTQTLDSQDNKAFVWLFQHPEEPRIYMPTEIDPAITGAGKLEHHRGVVTVGKSLPILAGSVLHFGEIHMPEARQYLKRTGRPVDLERTWLLSDLVN